MFCIALSASNRFQLRLVVTLLILVYFIFYIEDLNKDQKKDYHQFLNYSIIKLILFRLIMSHHFRIFFRQG
jgi:hypothetical protein